MRAYLLLVEVRAKITLKRGVNKNSMRFLGATTLRSFVTLGMIRANIRLS